MIDYGALPLGDKAPEVVNMVVEIPLQSINKYEYDKKLHVFRLDRNLYSPVHFPGDYGFLPSTLSHDGDPLDVLVLVDSPSFTGCVMEVRPIGVLDMLDQGVHDGLEGQLYDFLRPQLSLADLVGDLLDDFFFGH